MTETENKFTAQLRLVYNQFYKQPMTMKECDRAIGIMRENICWYCRELRKHNRLFMIGKKICSVTNHRANIYTTNPTMIPQQQHQTLFD
jgi:predicted transcriptional regulator